MIVAGPVDARQRALMALAAEALAEIVAAARPGRALGTLDDIHRRVPDGAGFASERFVAGGDALGATFRPSWMDVPPMIYAGNPLGMAPGMVVFVHIMIADRRTGLDAGLSQTFASTDGAAELFSALPVQLYEG